jgi:hypothetical protein
LKWRKDYAVPKAVIHLFHDDPDSLEGGARVADRVRRLRAERNVELEVYISGPAGRALVQEGAGDFACDGVPVRACSSIAGDADARALLKARGLRFEDAHDAFIRFAAEGATVFSF